MMKRLLLWSLLAVAVPAAFAQQQTSLPLGDIQATGTKRFTTAELAKTAGLTIGQPATAADFEAAAKRMTATGLFKRVAYRYAAENGKWILTFDIQDLDWNIPVVFDNFIWFSDTDLAAAMRDAVPSFAGAAPPTPEFTTRITDALQRLLKSRNIAGRVEFLPEGDLRTLKAYVFRVVDPAPQVCAWTFKGAVRISSKDLEAEMSTAGRAYSKTFVTRVSKNTVLVRYHRLGYWAATVSEPVTALAKTATCDGVAVTMNVTEGNKYTFGGATWNGNTVMTPADLDRILAMKAGGESGLDAIEAGLRRVTEAYGRKGYVTAKATFTQRPDTASHKATFVVSIEEGVQYRMGIVDFLGASPASAAEMAKRWRLKAGDVFDTAYPAAFQRDEIAPHLARGTKPPTMQMRINSQSRTVDVRFVFGQ